jgi:2-polyprenyl-3-methyl-5-hydroxy-6-metoxy-1,4-benzoquinol methylase
LSDNTLTYYNQNAEHFANSTRYIDMSELYQAFLPYINTQGLILDAGCGSARDAAYFKSQGFNVNAFDASQELAELASAYLQQEVEVKRFQELDEKNLYDGIWCCASLLHVPKEALLTVFLNLETALKNNGVLYVSFKYGTHERLHNGRAFTDLNEEALVTLLDELPQLSLIKSWQTTDQRPERDSEIWLNALIRKASNT